MSRPIAPIGHRVDGRPLEPSGHCGHYSRHWFSMGARSAGGTGVRTPRCVRCGASNPRTLTSDDWQILRELDWSGLTDDEKSWIDEANSEGWPEGQ